MYVHNCAGHIHFNCSGVGLIRATAGDQSADRSAANMSAQKLMEIYINDGIAIYTDSKWSVYLAAAVP